MAHNIYNDGQKDCFFAVGERKDVWHTLGQYVGEAQTWENAVKLAGLDWKIVKQQNYARNPAGVVVPTTAYSVFRSSDNRELGTVGEGYTVKQNSECFQFIDTLLEANGGSHYDTAGALGNGSKIFCSVRVPKADISVGDDKQSVSLIFTTSHDGSMSHTAAISATRPVCQNTLKAALSDASAMFRVRHTKNGDARLNRAKELMGSVTVNAKLLEEKLNVLARRKMTRKSMVSILNTLFPVPKDENASTTRRENVISDILAMYVDNDGQAFPEQRGTAYNMLNAITQYTDHSRTVRMTKDRDGMSIVQARAENAAVGSGDALKASALAVIERETVEQPIAEEGFANPIDDREFLKSMRITM